MITFKDLKKVVERLGIKRSVEPPIWRCERHLPHVSMQRTMEDGVKILKCPKCGWSVPVEELEL